MATTLSPGVGGAAPAIRRRRRRFRRPATVLLFMSPWIVGFFAFILYPMLASLYFSFTRYNLLQPPGWVGLFNYKFMFLHDPLFWQSVRNTVWIVLFGVPVSIVFAVGTAMVLTRVKVGSSVYRTMFFLPTMVPAVAATLAFVFLLNPSGPINTILRLLHIPQPLWFASPQWSKPALVGLSLWAIGETMIIFLAALLDVPRQLYEAADMEGAGPWQKFRHVTLPMISPVIFFSVVIGVIFGFQYFTQAYVASGGQLHLGDPQGSMRFYAVWMFQQIQYAHMGYASALAWVLFLVVMACTVVLIKTSRRWVHYQGGFR
ncbi:MAG TPA: sugar ABC transporter permease [Actinomycetota bacterium]|nr:sugar ABC transporter permease [Actinomycetota bacterium]